MTLPPPERQRLFFAITPSPELAQRFYQLANNELRDCRGRRLKPEQIHLTLRFIGSVNDELATCLHDAAGHIHLPSFELVLEHALTCPGRIDRLGGTTGANLCGLWPTVGNPRLCAAFNAVAQCPAVPH